MPYDDQTVSILCAYLDGALSAGEAAELRERLRRESALRTKLAELVYQRQLLVELGEEQQQRLVAPRSFPARRSARLRLAVPLAVAAGIAAVVVAGWWVSGKWQGARGKWQVVARVEAPSGQWTVASGQYGKKTALKVGDEIREGDRVVTGEGGRVRLAYVGEETSIELGSSAECRMGNAELLELRKGSLSAHVEKRSTLGAPSSAFVGPFTMLTPHAKVEVLGTRFTLRVEDSEKSQIKNRKSKTPSTWLHVESGLVRFTRLADSSFAKATEDKGKSIEVAAGQFAVAGEKAEDFALRTYPAGTEYVDGPILFHDDFEDGLGKWAVYVKDAEPPHEERELLGEDKQQKIPIVRRAVYLKGFRVERESACVVLDTRNVGNGALRLALRNVTLPEAFAVEFRVDVEAVAQGGSWSAPCFWDDIWTRQVGSSYRSRKGNPPKSWYRVRYEYRPVKGLRGDGAEVRSFYDGKPWKTTRGIPKQKDVMVFVRKARVVVSQVTIWELRKVAKSGREEKRGGGE